RQYSNPNTINTNTTNTTTTNTTTNVLSRTQSSNSTRTLPRAPKLKQNHAGNTRNRTQAQAQHGAQPKFQDESGCRFLRWRRSPEGGRGGNNPGSSGGCGGCSSGGSTS
ncbi:unnamed protein product, partial [Laminaria digitata]